jgi:hypothetical protein
VPERRDAGGAIHPRTIGPRPIDPMGVHRRRTYSVRSWEPTTRL